MCGVVVPGRNVEQASLGIEGWRRPHCRTRGPPFVCSGLLGLLRDGVGFPYFRAVLDAQRHHASAERAARIVWIGGAVFLPGSDGDEYGILIGQWSSCQAGGLMRFGTLLPQQVTSLRFDRVKPADGIAEEKSVLVPQRDCQDSRAHRAGCLKDPLDTSGFSIEGLHQAAGASHEQMTVENCGLRKGDDVAIESIRPLQLEPRYLADSEAGRIGRLIARVGQGGAPSVPRRLAMAG